MTLRGGRDSPIYFMPTEYGDALRKLAAAGNPIAPAHDDRLNRLQQRALVEPRSALSRMFAYTADAAMIMLCTDDRRLPIAMEADCRWAEAAYRRAREQIGEVLLVRLEGLVALRPSTASEAAPRSALVVERLVKCGRTRPVLAIVE